MNDANDSVHRSLDAENRSHLVELVYGVRWGALATISGEGEPMASSVAIGLAPKGDGFVLHLSRLAEHTRNLLARPFAGLLVSGSDDGRNDPQTLKRLSVQCTAMAMAAEHADYADTRRAYIARFPHAEARFGFTDFELFFLRPARAHYVGGFARAFALDSKTLVSLLAECVPGRAR